MKPRLLLCLALLLLPACVARGEPACNSRPAMLRRAMAALVCEGGQWAPGFSEGQRQVARDLLRQADRPEDLRLMAAHFGDSRETQVLEAMATLDGSPVRYTMGDMLSFYVRCRFRDDPARHPGNEPPEFASDRALAAWMARHEYDLPRMKDAYRAWRTSR